MDVGRYYPNRADRLKGETVTYVIFSKAEFSHYETLINTLETMQESDPTLEYYGTGQDGDNNTRVDINRNIPSEKLVEMTGGCAVTGGDVVVNKDYL